MLKEVENLPQSFIDRRKELNWSQRKLGEKLGLPEQQIQRYEKQMYRGASYWRLLEVARVLYSENDGE